MKAHVTSLPVEKAQRIISEAVLPLKEMEKVLLENAFFRVLAEEVTAKTDIPSHDNAAMDGYAFSAGDIDPGMRQKLKIAGSSYAGHRFEKRVQKGECVQIMTGSFMPDGCDTVIRHEDVTIDGDEIVIPAGRVSLKDNVRFQGEEIKAGDVCLKTGTLVMPAHLGMLASLGISELHVRRRPKVAFFSTGDELCPVGKPLPAGGIYDSNRYALYGMIKRLGCDVMDMGVVRDDPVQIQAALLEAARLADAVITTGGVSAGAADYTKSVLSEQAEMIFWHVNMRPGRPMAFGRILSGERRVCVFALPGNPVAVMTSFYFFVRDALFYLMGTRPAPLPRMHVPTLSPLAKRRGRTEFQRGILSPDEHGGWAVRSTGPQGSAMLSSMTQANCFIILPSDRDAVPAGDIVEVLPFDGLV